MRTWIVTGGCGFIGSNFILLALAKGNVRIVNLDALTYAANPLNLQSVKHDPRYRFVRGDVRDRKQLSRLFKDAAPEAVIHFAAESHVDRSIDAPDDFISTNVGGTFELLEACRSYHRELDSERRQRFRFLHVSTDEVYGSLGPGDPPFREDSPYRPNSPYSASKAAGDHLVRAYHHTYSLPTLTVHGSNTYGPHQFPEKLIPRFILNAINGRPLPLYGNGRQIRDWLYVEDHCEALLKLMNRGEAGETYNVGGACEKTNVEVAQTLCRLLDELHPRSPYRPHASLLTFVQDRPGHDQRYALDCRKLQDALGWRPRETFESGLRKTIVWYLNHPTWGKVNTQ